MKAPDGNILACMSAVVFTNDGSGNYVFDKNSYLHYSLNELQPTALNYDVIKSAFDNTTGNIFIGFCGVKDDTGVTYGLFKFDNLSVFDDGSGTYDTANATVLSNFKTNALVLDLTSEISNLGIMGLSPEANNGLYFLSYSLGASNFTVTRINFTVQSFQPVSIMSAPDTNDNIHYVFVDY